MLKEYIQELVSEVLRGFNLAKFKAISATNHREDDYHVQKLNAKPTKTLTKSKEQEYAEASLPLLGTGSSRVTFALSGGKVLKIATNQAGYSQNKAESDIWISSQSPYITTVYDFAPDYKWIISEIVKEMNTTSFAKTFGISRVALGDISFMKPKSFEDFVKRTTFRINNAKGEIQSIKSRLALTKGMKRLHLEDEIDENESIVREKSALLENKAFMSFLEGLIILVNKENMEWGDVASKHFGTNLQGQIKLLDYGLTPEVFDKFY